MTINRILMVFMLLATGVAAEDARSRSQRLDGLVESLNASSERRGRALELIYAELRGADSREMQQVLRESLSRQNTLILQGVVEAMAMLGDPDDLAYLEALLATNRRLEVKTLVIRLLPAYCLGHSERARFNYIRYAVGYERTASPDIIAPLRRPPITRRGRIDVAREQLQGRVVRALAGQFDPVAAALRYVGDRLYGTVARQAVAYYVGNSLGGDPDRWLAIWEAQGSEIEFLEPSEVEEIRLAVMQSLADMGAEGLPEVLAAFKPLLRSGGDILIQACFDTLAVMCRNGFETTAALSEMQFPPEDAIEGNAWRSRRGDTARDLAVFAAESAELGLTRSAEAGTFASAANCLGAALSFSPEFMAGFERLILARERGISVLERMAMMPDIARSERAAVLSALGNIGSTRAVAAVASLLNSPYCSPEFGDDGRLLAEAAVEALRVAAVGGHDGREMARELLLSLLGSDRMFPAVRVGAPPVGLAHMTLWRLQRLARTTDTSFDRDSWRQRLGW